MSKHSPIRLPQGPPRDQLQAHYDRLWSAATGKIRAGHVELDAVLEAKLPDCRRGLTLIARPSLAVRKRVAEFLDQLRNHEPEQHYYPSADLHITILSLFTATVDHEKMRSQTSHYLEAVDDALKTVTPIEIEFVGITASPGAVMIQGFVDDEALTEVRDALRHQLRVRGLGGGLDQRYRLQTAHMTIARFRSPLRDRQDFANLLQQARSIPFGATRVKSLSLVSNDWYMTRRTLQTLKRYPLGRQ